MTAHLLSVLPSDRLVARVNSQSCHSALFSAAPQCVPLKWLVTDLHMLTRDRRDIYEPVTSPTPTSPS